MKKQQFYFGHLQLSCVYKNVKKKTRKKRYRHTVSGVVKRGRKNTTEQYVTVEDGVTVVYITTYTDADPMIGEQVVTWYDANGTKYVNTIKPARQSEPDISMKVTWTDASGNTYVLDDAANTVTVYDTNGNVISVMPAK